MSTDNNNAGRRFDPVSYIVAGLVFLIACCTCWVAIAHSPELSIALKSAAHDSARSLGIVQDTESVARPALKPVEKPVKRARPSPQAQVAPPAPAPHPPIAAEAVVQNQRVTMQSHDKNIIVVQTH
jgi:hypothetical protein